MRVTRPRASPEHRTLCRRADRRSINARQEPRRLRGVGPIFGKRLRKHLLLEIHARKLRCRRQAPEQQRPGQGELPGKSEQRHEFRKVERMPHEPVWPAGHQLARLRQDAQGTSEPQHDPTDAIVAAKITEFDASVTEGVGCGIGGRAAGPIKLAVCGVAAFQVSKARGAASNVTIRRSGHSIAMLGRAAPTQAKDSYFVPCLPTRLLSNEYTFMTNIDEAAARQSPWQAGTGTLGGGVAGAAMLPIASAATLPRRRALDLALASLACPNWQTARTWPRPQARALSAACSAVLLPRS